MEMFATAKLELKAEWDQTSRDEMKRQIVGRGLRHPTRLCWKHINLPLRRYTSHLLQEHLEFSTLSPAIS